MTPPDLRVGLLGYGLAARAFHAPFLLAVPGLALTHVVTRSPERAAQARADAPGVTVCEQADQLWGAVDLVVVATPNRTHVPLGLEAVAAGVPVVVDKPLAPTAAEGLRLVEAAERAGVVLTCFQNRRWDSDVLTAQRLLGNGELGQPLRLETRFERWRPQVKQGWRESGDPAEAGGALLDLGAHSVDAALHLLGPVRAVYAEVDVRRPGAAVEDDVMIALTHSSGARSTHWLSAVAAHLGPRLRLLGERAAYVAQEMDPQEAALRAGERPGPGWGAAPPGLLCEGPEVREVPSEPGDYRLFYASLLAALRDGIPPPVPAREGLEVLRVLDAARSSARDGAVVRLEDPPRAD